MRTIIVYESTHHGNTKKLVDAIAEKTGVETVRVTDIQEVDFEQYDRIGIASGVAYGKFYTAVENFAADILPAGKQVFFLYTCGKDTGKYTNSITHTAQNKNCEILGKYGCPGYDTFAVFKLIGGISKGHPTQEEIAEAVRFYEQLSSKINFKKVNT